MLGLERHEAILRAHLEKYGCKVELGTELRSFTQDPKSDSVDVQLVKHVDGNEVPEKVTVPWVVGADGAHSQVRKLLGLTFLGDSRSSENMVVGDIHMKKGPSRDVCAVSTLTTTF
jgi:2-polyprenyl-6-methoxyphenol hydroxylase-like FAD-dependent oxidoreductase